MSAVKEFAHWVATGTELIGVGVILFGGGLAIVRYASGFLKPRKAEPASYFNLRRNLGQAILLGLEFLVAGDIIGTVSISPTFESVGVLAMIVLIRTFLSFSLEVELEGRWPWQGGRAP